MQTSLGAYEFRKRADEELYLKKYFVLGNTITVVNIYK